MPTLSFDDFSAAVNEAQFYYVRPYGIYWRGQAFWHRKLPRRPGAVVRVAEDHSTPVMSLIITDMDGVFLCSAWPIDWVEGNTAFQHELAAEILCDEGGQED